MMLFRILGAVLALIIVTPIVLINIWGINMSLWVNDITEYDQAKRNGEDVGERPQSMTEKLGLWYLKDKKLRKYFSTDYLSPARHVSYTMQINIDALLKPGETRPEEFYYPLYAKARVPLYLDQFCQEVLETVGTKCIVGQSSVKVQNDGMLKISGRLFYLPNYDPGVPQKLDEARFNIASARLASLDPDTGYLLNNAQNRAAGYKVSLDVCAELKKQYGNCIISSISFEVKALTDSALKRIPAGTNPERLNASASFTVYMPANKDIIKAYRETVTTLANSF